MDGLMSSTSGGKALNQAVGNGAYQAESRWKQMGYDEKKAAVHQEMERMNKLPANSTYATHRIRVLNKIMELMNIQRTMSQERELELLFASLSL